MRGSLRTGVATAKPRTDEIGHAHTWQELLWDGQGSGTLPTRRTAVGEGRREQPRAVHERDPAAEPAAERLKARATSRSEPSAIILETESEKGGGRGDKQRSVRSPGARAGRDQKRSPEAVQGARPPVPPRRQRRRLHGHVDVQAGKRGTQRNRREANRKSSTPERPSNKAGKAADRGLVDAAGASRRERTVADDRNDSGRITGRTDHRSDRRLDRIRRRSGNHSQDCQRRKNNRDPHQGGYDSGHRNHTGDNGRDTPQGVAGDQSKAVAPGAPSTGGGRGHNSGGNGRLHHPDHDRAVRRTVAGTGRARERATGTD